MSQYADAKQGFRAGQDGVRKDGFLSYLQPGRAANEAHRGFGQILLRNIAMTDGRIPLSAAAIGGCLNTRNVLGNTEREVSDTRKLRITTRKSNILD
jgi:hypothetical protein